MQKMVQNGSKNRGRKTGNTNNLSSPEQPARPMDTDRNQYNRWVFTLNNFTMVQLVQVQDFFNSKCAFNKNNISIRDYQFQEEIGSNGTPHLQGRFTLKDRCRFSALKKLFPTVHFEKENNEDASKAYCIKDETSTGAQYAGIGASPLIKIKLTITNAKLLLDSFENNFEYNLLSYPPIICKNELRRLTRCYWETYDELIEMENYSTVNLGCLIEHTSYINNL